MTKNKKSTLLQNRDWAILLLAVAVVATNWIWYQNSVSQDLSHKSHAESWVQQQSQINKLKFCIDENIRPCEFITKN